MIALGSGTAPSVGKWLGEEDHSDDETVEEGDEEFQFVTVEDSSKGERSDGGTGGGILPDQSAPPAASG